MFIKFEDAGAWQLFDDVDNLQYRKMSIRDCLEYEKEYGTSDLIDYTETLQANRGTKFDETLIDGPKIRVLLLFMNSKQLEYSKVLAFSPVYLMNNNGRTIETV